MELNIATQLLDYYKSLELRCGTDHILGVFLVGSQNYNFSDKLSDVDAKAIYIPSYKEILSLSEPKSYVYQGIYGQVEVKDIRLMWKMWKKQNINFLEVLFTDYYLINDRYQDLWDNIELVKGMISRYSPNTAITSIGHQALHTLSQIENGEGAGKKLANVERLYQFLQNYKNGKPYKECLTDIKNRDYLLELKRKDYLTPDELLMIKVWKQKINNLIADAKDARDVDPATPEYKFNPNKAVEGPVITNIKNMVDRREAIDNGSYRR